MRYYAFTTSGLETICEQEIEETLPGAETHGARDGVVRFTHEAEPHYVLRMTTTEDVFAFLYEGEGERQKRGKNQAVAAIMSSPLWNDALDAARSVKRNVKRVTYRVVVQRPHGRLSYRRTDFRSALNRAVQARFRHWKEAEENAHIEIWATQFDTRVLAGIRLSDRTMRHRKYKLSHIEASLRPIIARSMVLLSDPTPDDVFLDPMCGAGTILMERANRLLYRDALGGDVDDLAVAAASQNALQARGAIRLAQWDATRLPLPDRSVTNLVCNLPFGVKIGSPQDNERLYRAFVSEARRVLDHDGRMVLLTSERDLLGDCVTKIAGLRIRRTYRARTLGRNATVFCVRR